MVYFAGGSEHIQRLRRGDMIRIESSKLQERKKNGKRTQYIRYTVTIRHAIIHIHFKVLSLSLSLSLYLSFSSSLSRSFCIWKHKTYSNGNHSYIDAIKFIEPFIMRSRVSFGPVYVMKRKKKEKNNGQSRNKPKRGTYALPSPNKAEKVSCEQKIVRGYQNHCDRRSAVFFAMFSPSDAHFMFI